MKGFVVIIQLVILILVLAGYWKVFTKAGKPGWACLIPIYNIFVLMEIIGKPWWWLILMFVPIVNIIIAVIVSLELSKVFGNGVGFGIGLLLLPFIFVPVLGFSDASYAG